MPTPLRALLLAAALGSVGCGSHNSDTASADAKLTVQVRKPAAVDRPLVVAASGTLEARQSADLAFEVAGRVDRLYVEEGDGVRAGQVLAELDSSTYRLAVDQARAASFRASDEYKRIEQLHERRSVSDADYTRAQTGAQEAAAQLGVAEKQLADCRLTTPISGVISRRAVDIGETTAPGVVAFTVVETNPIWVRVGVPESDIGRIREGQSATVTVPALPGRTFTGRVRVVGVAADPASRTYTVKIEVSNRDRALKAGMVAEGAVRGDRMERGLSLPGEAIVHDPDGATLVYFYQPSDSRVYTRRVEVGPFSGREIIIAKGVTADDLIVVGGQTRLRDGMAVTATEVQP